MSITGPEPVVSGVRQWIDDNVRTHIASINAEVTDGCTLDDPIEVLNFVPSRSYLDAGMPMIGLQHGRLKPEDDTGWGFTGVLPVTAVVFDTDPDLQRLASKMMRWQTVMMRTLLPTNRVITEEAWAVKYISSDPGPTLRRESNPQEYFSVTTTTVELRFTQDV